MTAQARGWGPGWPANRRPDMIEARGGGVSVLVHQAIAPLVAYLLDETARRGYWLRPGECWGYANRPIKGTKTASNHSWGLAVDLNAPANPWHDKLITDMPNWMPDLWHAWGFRWGGKYAGKKDAMHYEFMGTPEEAADHIRGIPELTTPVRTAAEQPAPRMEVPPMINPPIEIAGRVVAILKAPGGGVWMATDVGAIYAWAAPDKGAPNRHPEYWGNRRAARLEPFGEGYRVVATSGEFYEFP